jgi:hypothetical protein
MAPDGRMTSTPPSDRDPEPGDFDDELAAIDPRDVEHFERSRKGDVAIRVTMRGEDAIRLDRLARARGQQPGDLLSALLRDADPTAG